MKKLLLTAILFAIVCSATFAQKKKKGEDKTPAKYEFTIEKENPITSVKNQYRSGTCWSFSALGFLEAELLRKDKGEYDLAEGFIIRKCYEQKAIDYVRWHGNLNFGGGGAFHDITWTWENYGIVPESAYPGTIEGEELFVHGEMDEVMKGYVDAVIKNKNRKLSKEWIKGFSGVADAYLGEAPETFMYKEVEYTPMTFAASLDLNMDDYIEIGSYSHHPFYEEFILEVPDNWLLGSIYNLPIDEMIAVMDNAIMNGYTIGWGADVSNKGFSWGNRVAIIPGKQIKNMKDSEVSKWDAMSKKEQQAKMYSFDGTANEMTITQEIRQEGYDNYLTTDDHGMLIYGIAKDQNGNKFYMVKNSWSEDGLYEGCFFASEAFVRMQTIDFIVHKEALPADIKSKLKHN